MPPPAASQAWASEHPTGAVICKDGVFFQIVKLVSLIGHITLLGCVPRLGDGFPAQDTRDRGCLVALWLENPFLSPEGGTKPP
jgi:hypothetical protein